MVALPRSGRGGCRDITLLNGGAAWVFRGICWARTRAVSGRIALCVSARVVVEWRVRMARANGVRVRLLAALVLVRPALDVDGLSAEHSEGDWRRVELVCLFFQNMLRVY